MPLRKRSVAATVGLDPIRNLAATLSVQSLDLRAQYEAKLRILTAIQRELEAIRSINATPSHRTQTFERLEKRFDELTTANRDASEMLKMVREAFGRVRRTNRH